MTSSQLFTVVASCMRVAEISEMTWHEPAWLKAMLPAVFKSPLYLST